VSDKELIERLRKPRVMSGFATKDDLYCAMEADRLDAADAIERAQEWRQSAMELQTDLNRIREWMKSRAYRDGDVLSVEICDLDEKAVGGYGDRIDEAINAVTGGGSQ